jgi:GDP-L-fucose synthase
MACRLFFLAAASCDKVILPIRESPTPYLEYDRGSKTDDVKQDHSETGYESPFFCGVPLAMTEFDLRGRRVWVAGHHGMVGSAVVRRLEREPCEILTVERSAVDLRRQSDVEGWMMKQRPDVVILAAATVGGILANSSRPAEFLFDNLAIEQNIIDAAYRSGATKLLFLGSSCIYPRLAAQPINEDSLLTGPLEPTNEWYAIAKITGIKLCQAYRRQYGCRFISAMPTNLYGPEDNFDLQTSHVLPALLAKIHRAKTMGRPSVEIWGSGTPMREFLHVDDLADAVVFLLQHYEDDLPINVGTGTDVTIRELAEMIAKTVGFTGAFTFDASKPDGMPRKLLNVGRLTALGWRSRTSLEDGLKQTYRWYLERQSEPPSLEPIVWTSDHRFGIEDIDDDHQKLVLLFNELLAACSTGAGGGIVEKALNAATSLTRDHFAREERHLKAAHYPRLDSHQQEHRALLKQLQSFGDQLAGGTPMTVDPNVIGQLRKWAIRHIFGHDRDIIDFLQKAEME